MPAQTMTTRFTVGQQAMNAGHADVVKMLDFVAHDFGGDHGLFSHGNVAGSRRDDGNDSLAIFGGIALQNDGARQVAIFGGANFFLYRGKLLFIGARGQDVAAVFGETGEDSRDLRRSLALSEDDFGHAIAQSAVVIDFGESEILERQVAEAGDRVVGRQFAFADLLEKLADRFGVQEELNSRQSAFSRDGV
jgi:hypothetical protein